MSNAVKTLLTTPEPNVKEKKNCSLENKPAVLDKITKFDYKIHYTYHFNDRDTLNKN